VGFGEREVATCLKSKGVEYCHQYAIGRHNIDFYLPKYNLLVEVEGSRLGQKAKAGYFECRQKIADKAGHRIVFLKSKWPAWEMARLLKNDDHEYHYLEVPTKSVSIRMPVLRKTGKRGVHPHRLYCLEIEDDHSYVSTGIVSHNCRPPGNNIEPHYIECCRPNLINTIKELKPNVIILLGKSAVESLIGVEWGGNIEELGRWVGWRIPSRRFNAWICPTYHPSFIVRSNKDPALVKVVQRHIADAMEMEDVPVPSGDLLKQYRAGIECISDPRQSIKRMKKLVDKEGILGFDYETDRLKPEHPDAKIVAVSFCLNGHNTFSCAIDESCYPVLSQVLKNERLKKLGSNIKFEERWTRSKLGHGVAGWWWDTMLGAHTLDNRGGITSIKFQAYVHLGICDYNSQLKAYLEAKDNGGNTQNNIDKMHINDLLPYCGLDSRLEYEVAMIQRKQMGLS
jgi:uracil-DNA glycosylase family 4